MTADPETRLTIQARNTCKLAMPNLEQKFLERKYPQGTEIRLLYTLPEAPRPEQEDKRHGAKSPGFGAKAETSPDPTVNVLAPDSTAIIALRQYHSSECVA
jgi:hypothetical protein